MSWAKKVWADPVWSKVISAGIIAAFALISTYLAGIWPEIGSLWISAVALALSFVSVPVWLLAVLGLCAAFCAFIVVAVVWSFVHPATTIPQYVEDEFFGIHWRWKFGGGGMILGLASFCPRCDYQIFPEDISAYRAAARFQYRCDECGSALRTIENMQPSELESRVERLIQKKLRSASASP